ncbi:helix-turn-helix domain-containing protein [Candidatus Puniceispirillum sp.]|uniref:helix-turn-helix domain-containing protein n=1 Tax=Candidatus Puniceispirillum sp. TaxID=2026719 RepID=UPI003F6953E5
MNLELAEIQKTTDKLITEFCLMYDADQSVLRKEVADITPSQGAHNDEYVAQATLKAVWSAIAVRAKGYEFAILVGSKTAEAPPIPFNFMKNYAPDLRSVFQRAKYFTRYLPAADIKCRETADNLSLYMKVQDPDHGSCLRIASYFTFLIKMARAQTSEPFIVKKLELDQQYTNCLQLRDFMGCDIEYCDTNSIHIKKSEATVPFLGANAVMWTEAESELWRRSFGAEKSAIYKDVFSILIETLPMGNGTIDPVIERMGISKRTLQRRLKKDGISFRELLNETRFWLASEFLKQGDMSKTEIAYRLGYSDPNSFYRVHKAWKKSRFADGKI